MRKDLLGIDIGSALIKFVTSDSYLTIDTPDNAIVNGELVAFDGIGELIKETIKSNNIKQKKVALILPDTNVYIKRINMPYMTIKQLDVNLPYEFKDVVGKDKDDYLYDYCFIDHTDTEMELVGGAVNKQIIEKYSDMFKTIGLKLVKVTSRTLAITDMLGRINVNNDVVLVGLGHSCTRVDIYKNGFYYTSRTIDEGVKDMVKVVSETLFCDEHIALKYLLDNKDNIQSNPKLIEIYEDITTKINRAINYYAYENKDNTLDNLYIYGGATVIKPFVDTITNNAPLTCKSIKELFNSDDDVYVEALGAYGAIEG